MAIELCSEKSSAIGVSTSSSNSTTPRISFSYDFIQSDVVPTEQRPLRSISSGLNSSIDFDFCVRESFDHESSSADELFSDGKILPTDQIKKKNTTTRTTTSVDHPKLLSNPQADHRAFPQTHGVRDETSNNSIKKETNSESKSFWRFKRSSSCGSGYGRTLCPLPLLSRSNSTGSAEETKPINIKREGSSSTQKQNSQKQSSLSTKAQPQSTCGYQKPPLKKGHGAYGNGVLINPVLNVPPANLFAIGSIFSNGSKNGRNKKK